MTDIIKNEPVLIHGVSQVVVVLLLAFGLKLSPEQIGVIVSVLAMVMAYIARKFVTPVNQNVAASDAA